MQQTNDEQPDLKNLPPPSPKVSITDLSLSTEQAFPLNLDFDTQIKVFLQSGTLKQIEHPALRDKVLLSMRDPRISKMCSIGVEIVLITKYPNVLKAPQYLVSLKNQLSKTYVKFFSQLPQPKDDIVNYVIFACSYNIHWMIWKVFKEQREEMDLRFVFDCYHILVFYLNGMYVSDSFIRVQIEKIFSSKFMEYEREKKEKLILQKLEKKKKNNERAFLGTRIDFPDLARCQGGVEFTKMLNDKFKAKKGGQFFNVEAEQPKVSLHEDQHPPRPQASEAKLLLQNLQLNVNQVSPSVYSVLQMNKMQLPFSRKKMLSHTFEKNDEKTEGILALLKEMTNQRKQKKDPKQTKKYQKSLIEVYDLRAPGKEYFQKHQKVDGLFKDMLELNYVLSEYQESMNSLYSTKELKKHLQELPDDNYDPKMLSPQQRIMSYLLQKQSKQIDIAQTMPTEVSSPDPKLLGKSLMFPPLAEKTAISTTDADTVKHVSRNGFQKHIEALKTLDDEDPGHPPQRKLTKHVSKDKLQDEFYQDKKKMYKQKYEPLVNKESTDSKISHIVQNLQVKQNLIGKSLSKKIHRM